MLLSAGAGGRPRMPALRLAFPEYIGNEARFRSTKPRPGSQISAVQAGPGELFIHAIHTTNATQGHSCCLKVYG
jgi:hypothetical protein